MEYRYVLNNQLQASSSPHVHYSSNYSHLAPQARAAGYTSPQLGQASGEFFIDHNNQSHTLHSHPNRHAYPLSNPQLCPPPLSHPPQLCPPPLSHPPQLCSPPQSLSRPQLCPPPHPHAVHETILREIEKERIREQIIAAEIARKRALEAEVRRELMIERELSLQRGGDGFPVCLPPQIAFDPPTRLAVMGTSFEGWLLEERVAMLEEATRRLTGVRESGGLETLPFQRRAVDLRISEIKPVSGGGKERVILLAKPNKHISGSKRKVSTPPGTDAIETPSDEILKRRAKEEWSCALCKVVASCERALNEHLLGKRHKLQTTLRAQRVEKNYSIGLFPKKATKLIKTVGTINPRIVDGVKFTSKRLVSKKKNQLELVEKVQKNNDQNKERYNFWCEMCKVGTLSLKSMNNHKKGKKHVGRVEICNRNGGSHPKKIAILTNHVKCDDGDGNNVISEHIDETSDGIRVEDDKPVDVIEQDHCTAVDIAELRMNRPLM